MMTRHVVAAIVCFAVAWTVPPAQDAVDPDVARPAIKQGSRLQGMAYLTRTRKVVGASILVSPKQDPSRLFVTSSDDKGQFRVDDLPDGHYRVEAEREGLAPVIKDDIGLRFPFRAVVEFPMRPVETATTPPNPAPGDGGDVAVHGTVVARGEGPLAEVLIRFVRRDGQADPQQVRSGPDGSFEPLELRAGSWRLETRGVGFLPIRIDVDFRDDTDLTIAMVRQPADYDPSPLELMPPEEPVAPADMPRVLVQD